MDNSTVTLPAWASPIIQRFVHLNDGARARTIAPDHVEVTLGHYLDPVTGAFAVGVKSGDPFPFVTHVAELHLRGDDTVICSVRTMDGRPVIWLSAPTVVQRGLIGQMLSEVSAAARWGTIVRDEPQTTSTEPKAQDVVDVAADDAKMLRRAMTEIQVTLNTAMQCANSLPGAREALNEIMLAVFKVDNVIGRR